MSESYVVNHQGCYRLVGTRVSLDSIVYAFLDGDTPETILQSFPVLTLEQVYGAIAYYLAHRREVDEHLRLEEADFEEKRRQARLQNPQLYQRLEEARRAKLITS
ncbi:MAG: hypothetical protein DMG09_02920 [Acidobacteria bacterium]|nr:MAG: hypothetical protein DMG09_02920 [Acidobacteriota bacterium]